MGILIGLVVTLGCVLGGFMAMGGHIEVLIQPWEVVIICGAALGSFLVANPMKVVKDTGKAWKIADSFGLSICASTSLRDFDFNSRISECSTPSVSR